jgi:Tfp pilus assembly protein PilX
MVISLMFLFISTLLGVASLRTNFFNEKMTLANIQREQALEAAEVALLEGEALVETFAEDIIAATITGTGTGRTPTDAAKNCTATVEGSGGICVPKEHSDAPGDNYHNWIEITGDSNSLKVWSTSSRHRKVSEFIKEKYELSTSPSYIIEFMGYIVDPTEQLSACAANLSDGSPNSNADPDQLAAWPWCSLDNAQFRVTAYAAAGNYGETRVMLQSTYVVDI